MKSFLSVVDTGIGIPADKQQIVVLTFQQADGTTSRKYGGTGLGLSISVKLAHLLGGDKSAACRAREASTFPCRAHKDRSGGDPRDQLPRRDPQFLVEAQRHDHTSSEYAPLTVTVDDRANIAPGERMLLIVEDDALFAQVLLDIAHEKGFKGSDCHSGRSGTDAGSQV
jgi:hypothetical protein